MIEFAPRAAPPFHAVRRRALLLAAALAVGYAASSTAQPASRLPPAPRIVAVADVHGAYEELVALLEAAAILGEELEWRGGDSVLVSVGDLLDRGADSRRVMDLLMRLQREAPEHGGLVHVLLGNHEAMNLTGDLRYVAPGEYAAFAADEPAELRAAAYDEFVRDQPGQPAETVRAAFDLRYPPGYFAHRRAFGAGGRYAEWLLRLPAVIVVGETAFVHGGLSTLVAAAGAEEINRRVQDALRRQVELSAALDPSGMLLDAAPERAPGAAALLEELRAAAGAPELGSAGPLWYRGSAYCNPTLERPVLTAALERLGAERVVIGHTPTDDRRVRELYDGRLIMLDTGMLADYYSGRPAALLIENGETRVQYAAPPERLSLERGRLEAYGATEDELLAALASGAIESPSGRRGEPRAVEVRHGASTLRARLYEGRAADAELAAHALDRWLGLHLVPPTVARSVNGELAALQLHYPNTITEAERVERRVPMAESCPLEPQWQLMYAFDSLLGNAGRAPAVVLYRRESGQLKLVGHEQAFGTERRARVPEGGLELPAAVRLALASLDEERVRTVVGGWLDERRIRALLARRDALLEHVGGD